VSSRNVQTRSHGRVQPKKRFGQHFLTSPYYARRIAEAIQAPADATVLEIGAGKGFLSGYLLSRFPHLHLVEMDRDIIPILRDSLGGGGWTLHECNVLDLDFVKLKAPLHVVGNLPYNIAALIIKKALMHSPHVASCTFTVQREVAERIVSGPHSKRNGFLSVFCQFFGSAKILFHVPPGAFFPKPRVESSVVQLRMDGGVEGRLPREQWEVFFSFVDRGFSARRKMLVNTLGRDGAWKGRIAEYLERTGVSARVRPEELGVNAWLALYSLVRGQ